MDKQSQPYFVQRTCTRINAGALEPEARALLETYRDQHAYVLLGDPGAGKTKVLEQEAEKTGGQYIKARDFATFEPQTKNNNAVLFIDGLDEMRADSVDGRTPLDQIRKHLEKLGRPRFRLSCRQADWFGASDHEALGRVSSDGTIVALHLDPLTDDDIIAILQHKEAISDPDHFVAKAEELQLGELLRNPQMLNLLVEAAGENEWPGSRQETYEKACNQLIRELNPEHRDARRRQPIPDSSLIGAAGYLCAVQLLSGRAGYALDDSAINTQYAALRELDNPANFPLKQALATNLFNSDGENRRFPIHRTVAEYLGARCLAELVQKHGLPIGRVVALITGEDGGVVTDLRGLSAWLAVHCQSGREILIDRDPLGVVLYGDVKHFPVADKKRILTALANEARRYPWFRSDDWSSPPFGALGTLDMADTFNEILVLPSREDADQSLVECVLDAIRYGERMAILANRLSAIVSDITYRPRIRAVALKTLMHVTPHDDSCLVKLVEGIRAGTIEDRDDELLGILLGRLYPHTVSPQQVFDYLHVQKDRRFIGSYSMFWIDKLSSMTTQSGFPTLLNQLVQRRQSLPNILFEYRLARMVGKLLVNGLESNGDTIKDDRLYDWLGIGLDEHSQSRLDRDHEQRIAQWLAARPDRYKAMLAQGTARCAIQDDAWRCLCDCSARLYHATEPPDIVSVYLEMAAAAKRSEVGRYYFDQAVATLKLPGRRRDLTPDNLNFLDVWVTAHSTFRPWLEPHITCPIGGWEQNHALTERDQKSTQQRQKSERIKYYRENFAAIYDGSAHPEILYVLAMAHEGFLSEAHGETPCERLEDFLDGDAELIVAALAGLRNSINRNDLRTVAEIIELHLKGKTLLICLPCLVGMNALFQSNPSSSLEISDAVLSRLVAFRLTDNPGHDASWFDAALSKRPSLVAEVLVAYVLRALRAGKESVSVLHNLANDDKFRAVARIALPTLLEAFPLRARKSQFRHVLNPLLASASRHIDKANLLSILKKKLGQSSMDKAQPVYWIVCGLLIAPGEFESLLKRHIGTSQVRRRDLSECLNGRNKNRLLNADLPVTTLAILIELLAPTYNKYENLSGDGLVTGEMETADLVHQLINDLGGRPSEEATLELERLVSTLKLSSWHNVLLGALHTQRIARRKASFQQLSVVEVSRVLGNVQPANAADLAALVFDHLRDIARKIRDGNTNDYKQYWSYEISDNKIVNPKPKPENDCRDALLSDLQERLCKLDIDAEREGSYADDKRSDIRVSFGGSERFNVPIEIKRDSHRDLWRAIHEQLMAKYIRDPGAQGYGIYVVFWFGGKEMPPPSDGKKPRSPQELEARLRQTLKPEDKHRISICVINCALP